MNYSPHTHLAIAKARQEDLIREARQRELARLVRNSERHGLGERLGRLLRRRSARPAATSPA